MMLSALRYRVYQDLFMGSRLHDYRRLLRCLNSAGYHFTTFADYAGKTRSGLKPEPPVCLLRNDVDTDPLATATMFNCDRDEGVRATYYFRLATLDAPLIDKIVSHGGEVGYHYEEIATFARKHGIASRRQIDAHLEEIQNEFRDNLRTFAARAGVMPRTIASHGDFINRRIGVANQYLLTRPMMAELGIIADAYDPTLHANLAARFSDCAAPVWWRPENPLNALAARPDSISILVHPRQWICSPVLNLCLDVARLRDEALWLWRGARTALRSGRIRIADQA